HMPIC
ncbi:hypothetical protein VCHC17A1_3977B, partial [Vibrio cholerae HC-17A1]